MSVKALKPVPTWLVRVGHDWAHISIDEETGVVAITSSYGDYTYIWRSIGTDTLLEFVCGLNFDYAMGKFLGQRSCFDAKATIKSYREAILEYRLRWDIEEDDARKYWNELGEIEDHDSVDLFHRDISETDFAGWFEDWWEYGTYTHPPRARMFWDTLWAEFVKEVSP